MITAWVILAKQVLWQEVEAEDIPDFSEEDLVSLANSSRIAFGALILRRTPWGHRSGTHRTDCRESLSPILSGSVLMYQEEVPFHHSLLTHFRKWFSQEALKKINEAITRWALAVSQKSEEDALEDEAKDPRPKGKLIVDATCPPADIKYPTDLNLLSEAREKTEAIIDHLPPSGQRRRRNPGPIDRKRERTICASPR